jgi:GAF domain-containing protein
MDTDDQERARELLTLAAATATVAAAGSHSQLLELIVQIAARVIRATTASMMLVDRTTQELVFTVAFPHRLADLAPFRVPVGEGIAGLVAMTGQPMAISDARADPRHASPIAEQTGYLPNSLLCVPLVFADEVVGVLELMDKQDASAFDNTDIETLGLFANLAAVAIEQSQTRGQLTSLLSQVTSPRDGSGQLVDLAELVSDVEQEPRFRRTLELAQLVHQIGQAGEQEVEACAGILRSFAGYVGTRSQPWQV